MSEIKVGMEVRHRASKEKGIAIKISDADGTVEVSWGSGKTTTVPLAAIEPFKKPKASFKAY